MHYSDLPVVCCLGSTGVTGKLWDLDHLDMLKWFVISKISPRQVLIYCRIKLSKTSLKVYKKVWVVIHSFHFSVSDH